MTYLDALPEGQVKSSDLAFGSAIHSALHAALSGYDAEEAFLMCWDNAETKALSFGRYGFDYLKDTGLTLVEKFCSGYVKKISPVLLLEKRLYSEFEGLKLEGTPDCIAMYQGKITLFDWKTTSSPYPKEKAISSLQLHLYAYLAKQNGYAVEQAIFLPFRKNDAAIQTPVVTQLTDSSVRKFLDDLSEWIQAFTKTKKFPRNTASCFNWNKRCEFFNRCHNDGS